MFKRFAISLWTNFRKISNRRSNTSTLPHKISGDIATSNLVCTLPNNKFTYKLSTLGRPILREFSKPLETPSQDSWDRISLEDWLCILKTQLSKTLLKFSQEHRFNLPSKSENWRSIRGCIRTL